MAVRGTITYGYDEADRRTSKQVAGQTAVSYTYDDADRLTDITQGTATVTFGYDGADRRTSLTLPNGIVVEYGYDAASQLTGLTYKLGGATLGTLVYGYDTRGQRTSVGGTYARTGLPAALTSATYDDANQIATFGGVSSTYDSNGNLTSDGSKTYTWNARDQLTAISGAVSASFAYDGVGRRRSKTIGSTTTQFLYDGLNPVQELLAGTPTANLLTGLGIDEYFTRTDGSGTSNYLTDALGSSVGLANGSGTMTTEYTYEPFGATSVSGASTGNAFGFTGREDDGTGLYYYRARYYDPRVQRFVAEDPLGFEAGDVDLYVYVSNNPVMATDPLGLELLLGANHGWVRPAANTYRVTRAPRPSPTQHPRPVPGRIPGLKDLAEPGKNAPLWRKLLRKLPGNPFDDNVPWGDLLTPPPVGRKPPPCDTKPVSIYDPVIPCMI